VVRVEDTSSDGGTVTIFVAAEEGSNIRRAGEDIEPGAELLEAGATLGAAELGVLASVGVAEPSCRRRPRVQILGTGDELVGVGEALRPGAVRNSNFYALSALARSCTAEPLPMAVAPDSPELTVAEVRRGLEADVLIVSGGISVGEHDHVRAAFTELGVEEVFWRVSLKPGKPAYFGTTPGTLVFGLPGNPVSAYVTFVLLVRPALLALQGAEPSRTRTTAELTRRYEKPADRAHAIRCRLELGPAGWLATPASHQGSHVMTSLVGADALAVIGAEATVVEAGERVTVELLDRAA
jgi:molybdopterin molybdotransferase